NLTGTVSCCANYYKDDKGNCNLCAPGYYGDSCEIPCPSGSFGVDCGGQCHCSAEDCDHVRGCSRQSNKELNLNRTQITTEEVLSTSLIPKTPFTLKEKKALHTTSPAFITSSKVVYSTNEPTVALSATDFKTTKEMFNSNYLLFGVGIVLAILLTVIILQLRSKSKSAQRMISRGKNQEQIEMNLPSDLALRPSANDKKQYSSLNQGKEKLHVYQQVESEYQEIDPCLEMIDVSPEEDFQGPKSVLPNTLPLPMNTSKRDIQKTEEYIEPMTNVESTLETYLEPISSESGRMSIKDPQRHSYIEILDSDEIILEERKDDRQNKNTSKSSSSYDDVVVECITPSLDMDEGNHATYLDVVFK
ncbi:uncharacterized protein LOC134245810, partial [Saccostrea cucullata]|uniref:uncharacterized protein LOC134245810 n=1 Tax=Saccostrea cuccullata TaxID=36930 RepID=UPI002ED6925D